MLSTRFLRTLCTRRLRSWGILDTLNNESGDGLEGFKATFEGLHWTLGSPGPNLSGPNCARCLCLSHPLFWSPSVEYYTAVSGIRYDIFLDQSKTRYKHLLIRLATLEFTLFTASRVRVAHAV